jgi:Fe2+ or Zn2+ uptake regulation protein
VTDARHAVLELLLDHHPGVLSIDELVREMTAGSEAFAEQDPIKVAARELVEAGLAHRLGAFVFASHAAATFRGVEAS